MEMFLITILYPHLTSSPTLFLPHQKPSANKRTSSVALKRSIAAFLRSFTSEVRRIMDPFISSSPPADCDFAAAA
ncbi:hypothetical protein CEXT_122171 [Caerostris extrusa]|uniref:Uncharacterized protein n=1 Tax=Caerostris extrusa TaxID=172846 RepID=A0AAV4QN98_CAEEX|nr:hypothetical protein CEXT_122171 [Caerostris extrusa]